MDMKKKKKNRWIYDRFDYDLFQDRGCDKTDQNICILIKYMWKPNSGPI